MNPERDLHDAALAALLREHASETPAAHIDAAVRAAAHREIERASPDRAVAPHARAQQAWRWWMPLAAAAVVGVIVIGVLPLAPSIVDDTAQRASDMPAESTRSTALAPAAPVPQKAAPSAQPTEATAPVPTQKAATTAPRREAEPPSAKVERARPPSLAQSQSRDAAVSSTQGASNAPPASPTFAPPPSLAAASPPADAQARADARARDEAQAREDTGIAAEVGGVTDRVEGPNADLRTAERSQSAIAASAAADGRARSIADWIARLRELRNAGDAEEALRELRRYRATFDDADARLPPDLAEWARSRR
jgi:hypothetical protein